MIKKPSKKILDAYALLIVKRGAAIKKGQDAIIVANVETEPFAVQVGKACYKLGARRVIYQWQSDLADRIGYKYGKPEALGTLNEGELGMEAYKTHELPALIYLEGNDPDALSGIRADRLATIKSLRYAGAKSLIEERENKYQWVIAGAPTAKWAKKVFPNLRKSEAINALWWAILKASRADDGNGLENWEKHDSDLKIACEKLNALKLVKLHYLSKNGTDLTVGLIPEVKFEGGFEVTKSGVSYDPNIPSEECFTSPMRGEAEGIVHSAKPLVYQSQLIDRFWIRFEKGKAIDAHAEVGDELLKSIFTIDEGSAYLGECALVPYDSPINNLGIIFYSTLYDENAACHLALGRGFTQLYPDFQNRTEDEIHALGINKSLSHVDFMIGTRDLTIIGTTSDGEEVKIFDEGNFAI